MQGQGLFEQRRARRARHREKPAQTRRQLRPLGLQPPRITAQGFEQLASLTNDKINHPPPEDNGPARKRLVGRKGSAQCRIARQESENQTHRPQVVIGDSRRRTVIHIAAIRQTAYRNTLAMFGQRVLFPVGLQQ